MSEYIKSIKLSELQFLGNYFTSTDDLILPSLVLKFESNELIADAGNGYEVIVEETIELRGTASGGTQPYIYYWDLDNDGIFEITGQDTIFTSLLLGNYIVNFKVIDSENNVSVETVLVSVVSNLEESDLFFGNG